MRTARTSLAAAAAGSAFLALATAASAAPPVIMQKPCPAGPCVTFGTSGDIPAARTVIATAPYSGFAVVTFSGSMNCSASLKRDNFAWFETQIVESNKPTPDGTGAGGLQLFATLSSDPDHATGPAATYNLASSRTFEVAQQETVSYSLKIRRIRMGSDTSSSVGKSGAFTIQFVPRNK
jgi:hypothetical protein